MLVSLHVKNMALIREEEINFGEGLSILTGETGAGKSIIIGSIGVALGSGRFADFVPEGADYALVELVFETHSEIVLERLGEMDIPAEDGLVIISRKYQKGRSVSRVNGESVPISFVKEIAAYLIDIHGQHEHQSLLYPRFHLELLDRHGAQQLKEPMREYTQSYDEWRKVKAALEEALLDENEQARALDLARYEIREIEEAALVPGEDEQLEVDFRRMEHGQKIMEALGQVQHLAGAGSDAQDAVSRAVREISGVSDFDRPLAELSDQFAEIENLLGDAARALQDYMDEFAYDEQAFYETGQRLDQINHLKGRYGKTIEDILAYKAKMEEKAEQLENYEAYLQDLRAKEAALLEMLRKRAKTIRKVRKAHAEILESAITTSLIELNFLDVRFAVEFKELEEPGSKGMDEVCFLISTNPGMPLRPIQDTASGGELSRIMLAIKAVMADQDAVDTLIFDEIDTGISGRTAQKVSEKMAVIARTHQVLCITHLAQIAAMADTHYVIAKEIREGSTVTSIRQLADEEKADELARIIGGVSITDGVMESAREMLSLARERKAHLSQSSD